MKVHRVPRIAYRKLRLAIRDWRYAICTTFVLFTVAACAAPAILSPSGSPATLFPTPTPTPTPSDLYISAGDVTFYPGPQLYSGDRVTIDVRPRNVGAIPPGEIGVQVSVDTLAGPTVVASGGVDYWTFDDIPRARLPWAWDTRGLKGVGVVTVWLDPADRIQVGDEDPTNNVVTLTVPLLHPSRLPPVEAAASWITRTSDCCVIHYLSGTAADRDMPAILATTDRAVQSVQAQLDARLSQPLQVYLIDRVIGQGGYAGAALALSYLDRDYTAVDLETIMRHEATHVLDRTMGGEAVPSLLREGLAVWIAGGHYRQEPIPQRTAAVVELGWYVPLDTLANDFYRQQHEVGYLEGAALVDYLVETYGREEFLAFYTSFAGATFDTDAAALDAKLRESFDVGLEEVEQALRDWLAAHPPTAAQVRDLQDTVAFFETCRRYQQVYDPAAYFLTGWLPDPVEGERLGIEADFMRGPRALENIALETMLIAARRALDAGAFARAEALLDEVNGVLETGRFAAPLARAYLEIVQATASAGYEAQRVELAGDSARVWAVAEWPTLVELTFRRGADGWRGQ